MSSVQSFVQTIDAGMTFVCRCSVALAQASLGNLAEPDIVLQKIMADVLADPNCHSEAAAPRMLGSLILKIDTYTGYCRGAKVRLSGVQLLHQVPAGTSLHARCAS